MSIEDFNEPEIISYENMKKFIDEEVKPFEQNYGSYENLSDVDSKIMAAQVAEKRRERLNQNNLKRQDMLKCSGKKFWIWKS